MKKEQTADYYIKNYNFPSEPSGSFFPDKKFKQGVGRKFNNIDEFDNEHCVYMMVKNNEVLKFGDSENGKKRLNNQYISITNPTNDRIRAYVRKYGEIKIYIRKLKTAIIDEGFGPHKASIHSQLEKDLLGHFKINVGRLPKLNARTI